MDDYLNGRTPRASVREMLTVRRLLDEINDKALP